MIEDKSQSLENGNEITEDEAIELGLQALLAKVNALKAEHGADFIKHLTEEEVELFAALTETMLLSKQEEAKQTPEDMVKSYKEYLKEHGLNEEDIEDIAPAGRAKLIEIARDTIDGKIFTDFMIPAHEMHRIGTIFMPIMFSTPVQKAQFVKIGMAYEYYEKAMSRGINGLPSFTSMRLLNIEDRKTFAIIYNEMVAEREALKKKWDTTCTPETNSEVETPNE